MSLRINTNVAPLNAYNNLNRNQVNLEGSFEKLSSGLRINKAADDAAGLSIAQGLTSQINGLSQAVSNANDGINVAQIADGALGTTQDILQRMRGLIVKAGNEGTQDAKSLGAIQQEIQNLNTQLNNIAEQTKFGQTNLLNGTYNNNFQVGANGNDTIRLNLADASVKATDLKTDKLNIASGGGALISIAGDSTAQPPVAGVTAAAGFATALHAQSGTGSAPSGDLATVLAAVTGTPFSSADAVAGDGNGGWNIKNGDDIIGHISEGANGTFTIATVDADGNSKTVATVDTKSYDTEFTMSGVDGSFLHGTVAQNDAQNKVYDALKGAFGAPGMATGGTAGTDDGFKVTVDPNDSQKWTITQTQANAGDTATVDVAVGSMSLKDGVYTFSDTNGNIVGGVNSNVDAKATASLDGYGTSQAAADMEAISAAIDTVSGARSQIGAVQNQLSYTVSNLQTAINNVTASRSNLTDADLASEVTNMTQSQILTQAATSVLAQANSAPQAILKLLG